MPIMRSVYLNSGQEEAAEQRGDLLVPLRLPKRQSPTTVLFGS